MAKAALARVGCGREVVVGYFWHAVQIAFLEIMPVSLIHGIVAPTMQKRWKIEQEKMQKIE